MQDAASTTVSPRTFSPVKWVASGFCHSLGDPTNTRVAHSTHGQSANKQVTSFRPLPRAEGSCGTGSLLLPQGRAESRG